MPRFVQMASSLVLLALAGCGPQGQRASLAPADPDPDWDVAAANEVFASFEDYAADLSLFTERIEVDGCSVPRWHHLPRYHGAGGQYGVGMVLIDRSVSADTLDERRPLVVHLHLDAEGSYELAGLGWYHNYQATAPIPSLFGLPMVGAMQTNGVPGVDVHYRLVAWPWMPHPDLELGLFGMYNQAMEAPESYQAVEYMVSVASRTDFPELWDGRDVGVPDGEPCVRGAGGDLGYRNVVAGGKPWEPTSYFHDGDGEVLGAEWTLDDEHTQLLSEAGVPLIEPAAGGNPQLRVWYGSRFNPGGYFHPVHTAFSCDEEPACP